MRAHTTLKMLGPIPRGNGAIPDVRSAAFLYVRDVGGDADTPIPLDIFLDSARGSPDSWVTPQSEVSGLHAALFVLSSHSTAARREVDRFCADCIRAVLPACNGALEFSPDTVQAVARALAGLEDAKVAGDPDARGDIRSSLMDFYYRFADRVRRDGERFRGRSGGEAVSSCFGALVTALEVATRDRPMAATVAGACESALAWAAWDSAAARCVIDPVRAHARARDAAHAAQERLFRDMFCGAVSAPRPGRAR